MRPAIVSNYLELKNWDQTGKIVAVSEEVYRALESDPEEPKRIHIPASTIQVLLFKNGALHHRPLTLAPLP